MLFYTDASHWLHCNKTSIQQPVIDTRMSGYALRDKLLNQMADIFKYFLYRRKNRHRPWHNQTTTRTRTSPHRKTTVHPKYNKK